MSQQQPSGYTQEEEREAERLAIASGLGISEWPNFLSMARTNILRDGSVAHPTPAAKVSVSPAIEEATARPWEVFNDGVAQNTDMVDIVAPWSKTVKAAASATFGDYRGALVATLPYVNSEGSVPTKAQAEANAALIVAAVNAFDSNVAEIERLNSLHETLCSVLCRETQTETPIAAITAIRSNAAKVEKLEATLRSVIRAYDDSKTAPSPASAISVIRAAVEPARAALIESPEKENK